MNYDIGKMGNGMVAAVLFFSMLRKAQKSRDIEKIRELLALAPGVSEALKYSIEAAEHFNSGAGLK